MAPFFTTLQRLSKPILPQTSDQLTTPELLILHPSTERCKTSHDLRLSRLPLAGSHEGDDPSACDPLRVVALTIHPGFVDLRTTHGGIHS